MPGLCSTVAHTVKLFSDIDVDAADVVVIVQWQGRVVKGTSAPAPASVMLNLGDKALTVNDVSLEKWGTARAQEV